MTQQKSEDGVVPEDRRKAIQIRGVQQTEGGKAVPVNEQARQLLMPFATAENLEASKTKRANAREASGQPHAPLIAAPKAESKEEKIASATLPAVVHRLRWAFESVAANKGAPGPDRQSIDMVREHLDEVLPKLKVELLSSTYQPGMIRRVWIPKAGGGRRGLGIPNVIDRMVQEAVRGVLEPLYEPTFHPSSHGFRPGRSCHTAIAEAKEHIREGYDVVVDLDLEKFFDRVGHQRLMARLAQRVEDRGLLVLIAKMLKAKVVLPEGLCVKTEEGLPQGGPLSPLLSNIVLDELDWELDRRGHRFVRYADDCNIYTRSERAGQRVFNSVSGFIGKRLRLSVNKDKSAVGQPKDRHFLGFNLHFDVLKDEVEVTLSERSHKQLRQRLQELIPRNWGGSLSSCIQRLSRYLKGWVGFFGICTARGKRDLEGIDGWIRRRLRALVLHHWKRRRTIVRRLISLGTGPAIAWKRVYEGRKSPWRLSREPIVNWALRNSYFAELGLVSLSELLTSKQEERAAPQQLLLWDS